MYNLASQIPTAILLFRVSIDDVGGRSFFFDQMLIDLTTSGIFFMSSILPGLFFIFVCSVYFTLTTSSRVVQKSPYSSQNCSDCAMTKGSFCIFLIKVFLRKSMCWAHSLSTSQSIGEGEGKDG